MGEQRAPPKSSPSTLTLSVTDCQSFRFWVLSSFFVFFPFVLSLFLTQSLSLSVCFSSSSPSPPTLLFPFRPLSTIFPFSCFFPVSLVQSFLLFPFLCCPIRPCCRTYTFLDPAFRSPPLSFLSLSLLHRISFFPCELHLAASIPTSVPSFPTAALIPSLLLLL
ncbi:hypothetical protein BO94DRAFT_119127 [Aspergillus sclerotioniger CBS 115572]|uniref:Transmembrane protein n=1 Tax=Aspergillus sclerotioniger CBS 115572 TaxID=1450535 RepID=A0A317WG17_9EURO|nr:hypothetical protein BO94DRAFT_119127 [Aspergillus sclerotioniger CBS 115572]PWY83130.1 hypothetical protein BO94DRAFT_119127 [Aspergillus sclerotioniger CBS 115572]